MLNFAIYSMYFLAFRLPQESLPQNVPFQTIENEFYNLHSIINLLIVITVILLLTNIGLIFLVFFAQRVIRETIQAIRQIDLVKEVAAKIVEDLRRAQEEKLRADEIEIVKMGI